MRRMKYNFERNIESNKSKRSIANILDNSKNKIEKNDDKHHINIEIQD